MFCELNFEIMFFTLVSSALLTGMIIDIIRPLSTRIMLTFTFLSRLCN